MENERERRSAIAAGKKALESLVEAKNQLGTAKKWSNFDRMGGKMVTSFVKRAKADNSRIFIERAKYDMQVFKRELQSISIDLKSEIGDYQEFFDYMDSFFADVLDRNHIEDAFIRVDNAIYRVEDILNRIDFEKSL